jgi:hypothetical protein
VRTVPRTRHYVSPGALTLCRPVLAFDYAREAYVLRGIGDRVGPVLREDRRRRRSANGYNGPERRGVLGGRHSHVTPAPVKAAPGPSSAPSPSSVPGPSSGKAAPGSSSGRTAPGPSGRPTAAGTPRTKPVGQSRPKAAGQTRTKASRRPRSKNAGS